MAMIDYGAILKVNGKFINKNNLFMDSSDTGYICEKALYNYDGKEHEIDIDGNFFVYAGDKNFLLCFYKSMVYVIHNNKVIRSIWNDTFLSETFYFDNFPSVTIEHLDKNTYSKKIESIGTWEDYVKENWIGATGKEKLSELKNGRKHYKWFHKRLKQIGRYNKRKEEYKYKTQRWKATWEYNGNKYEVIFGYGIDSNEEVWNNCKYDYGFTDIEVKIIDKWFEEE